MPKGISNWGCFKRGGRYAEENAKKSDKMQNWSAKSLTDDAEQEAPSPEHDEPGCRNLLREFLQPGTVLQLYNVDSCRSFRTIFDIKTYLLAFLK